MNAISHLAIAISFCVGAIAQDTKLPDAGRKLKLEYDHQLEAAAHPIRERYLTELKKLQEQATRAGRLDDAIALRFEISRVAAQKFVGRYTSSAGGTIVFRGDGSAQHTVGNAGSWVIDESLISIKWSNGWITRFALSESRDKVRGDETTPTGKTYDVTLTRSP
jgi:hypothetical protein